MLSSMSVFAVWSAAVVLCLLSALHSADGQSSCNTTGLPSASSGESYGLSSSAFPNMSSWAVAGWGGDDDPVVAPLVAPVTLNGVLYPAGSWLWWGTQALVQISTDMGQNWAQLAYGSDYPSGAGSAGCAHRNSFNRFYVIGNLSGLTFVSSSNNGTQGSWYQTLSASTAASWKSRVLSYSQCVVDMADKLYSLGQSDVWRSDDLGSTFVNVTTSSIYSPRSSSSSTIWTATNGDVMVMLGGEAPNGVWLNDVWVSQTAAASWIRVTAAAPWQVRGGAALASTRAGVMVMHGGQGYSENANQWWTDAWVSLDGGYTWVELSAVAGPAISYQAAIVDPLGFFYAFGGQTSSYTWLPTGQKSNLSLLNIQQWAASVNGSLTLPTGYSPCEPYVNFVSAAAPSGAASSSSTTSTAATSATAAAPTSAASTVSSSSAAVLSSSAATSSANTVMSSAISSAAAVASSSPSITSSSPSSSSAAVSPTSASAAASSSASSSPSVGTPTSAASSSGAAASASSSSAAVVVTIPSSSSSTAQSGPTTINGAAAALRTWGSAALAVFSCVLLAGWM